MSETYTLIENLPGLLAEIQPESIISRTFYRGDRVKAILFGFDAGQELSEHTASQSVIVQLLQGEATITLGEDQHELTTGAWMQLPPRLKHSVYAKTPLILLLTMLGAD